MNPPRLIAILLVVTFLCLVNGQSHSRELKLNCPVDEFNEKDEEKLTGGQFDAYSRGAVGRDLVAKLRPKTEEFYQSVLNNALMYVCDVKTARIRCVDKSSPFAAKDWSGKCINAADYTCPTGTCETSSNCYWNTVVEGQNRTSRFPVEDYKGAEAALTAQTADSYAGGIALVGLIGTAISLLLLFFWIIFFVGRYFCCCLWSQAFCNLCSPIPKEDYRICLDIILPVIIYVIALIAIVISSSMAFVGNEDISVAASNAFLHSDGLVTDLMRFLGRSRIPLENVQDIVLSAALDAKGIFDGTDFVKKDANGIVDSFLGFYVLHSEGLNASGTLSGFNSATYHFQTAVTPITNNVQSLLDALELDLYDKADFIKDGLSQAMGQLDSFSEQSLSWREEIYSYESAEEGIRSLRQLSVMGTFLVSLGVAVLGLLGIGLSKTKLCSACNHVLKLTGFISAILGTLSLLVASIGLSANFLVHDACQISSLVTRDFEPFVGDAVAPAANAAFNDTNLAEALNLTEKVGFQQKLEEGLSQIGEINVTANFELVLEPLYNIQTMLGSISDTSLSILNQAVSSDDFPCAFGDIQYTKEAALSPWSIVRPTEDTPYIIRDNLGDSTPYDREGSESASDYIARIYNIAGICSVTSDCCIYDGNPSPPTCTSAQYASCDFGSGCAYPCSDVRVGIVQGFDAFVMLYNKELKMTADLGIVCPTGNYEGTCPTEDFRLQHSNLTLVDSIKSYRRKISATKDSLVSLASTSVGETMDEVQDFLCNMNVSFVQTRYDELKSDVCGKLFGGLAQIDLAFWIVGLGLEVIAIVLHVLSIRLKRNFDKDADLGGGIYDGLRNIW